MSNELKNIAKSLLEKGHKKEAAQLWKIARSEKVAISSHARKARMKKTAKVVEADIKDQIKQSAGIGSNRAKDNPERSEIAKEAYRKAFAKHLKDLKTTVSKLEKAQSKSESFYLYSSVVAMGNHAYQAAHQFGLLLGTENPDVTFKG